MLEALAAVALIGLMIVPSFNLIVGPVAGFLLGGWTGAGAGLVAGLIITRLWYPYLE